MAFQNPTPDPSQHGRPKQPLSNQEKLSLPPIPNVYELHQHETGTPAFYQTILNVVSDTAKGVSFLINKEGTQLLKQLDMFEWSVPYPAILPDRDVPFFVSDQSIHIELLYHYQQFSELVRTTPIQEHRPQRRPRVGRPPKNTTSEDAMTEVKSIEKRIDDCFDMLHKQARGSNTRVGEGYIRLNDLGELLCNAVNPLSNESAILALKILLRAEAADPLAKLTWRRLIEHTIQLIKLGEAERHLRKLNIGILQGSVDLSESALNLRFKQIRAETHTDTYLNAPQSPAARKSLRFLQMREGGNYCPTPYPSWQSEAKRDSQEQSKRIVTRARMQSYTGFQKLRLEARHLAGHEPLLTTFARDTHEDVRVVHGSDIDTPPGRGLYMSGLKLDSLFFNNPTKPGNLLENYQQTDRAWWSPALKYIEDLTVIPLRGWIGLLNPCPEFTLLGERYAFLIDNDHLSDQYGCAYGIPQSIVSNKIVRSLHELDAQPNKKNIDLSRADASISGLISATVKAGKAPLTFGTMSQLFGGMSNALPVGYAPTMSWEVARQDSIWKDIYNHVHWSWLVWSFQEERAQVDAQVAPISAADSEIGKFVTTAQQLFEIWRDRYAAWKNDQTPGEKVAPRMLVRAYEIHRAYEHKDRSIPQDETIYIGIYDRNNPGGRPTPVINCRNLEIMDQGSAIQLPLSGDGAENRELLLWKEHVKPLLESRNSDGTLLEGRYELAIIGDKDL